MAPKNPTPFACDYYCGVDDVAGAEVDANVIMTVMTAYFGMLALIGVEAEM